VNAPARPRLPRRTARLGGHAGAKRSRGPGWTTRGRALLGHDLSVSIWQDKAGESLKLPTEGTRFKGGVFVVDVEIRRDRILFSVYTSRATTLDELRARFTLRDSEGTVYVMASGGEAIDGKGTIEFVPGLPDDETSLTLGEPGRWLHLFAQKT